jgi:sortase (surface protein transpeptidase)
MWSECRLRGWCVGGSVLHSFVAVRDSNFPELCMRVRSFSVVGCLLLLCVLGTVVPSAQAAVKPSPHKTVAVTAPPGWPKILSIPRFGVRAAVESLKFNTISDVKAPYKWADVAWYNRGPRPGDRGRATIFGHLDSVCCPAVFWQLHLLHAGDIVQVAYKTGKLEKFRVMWQGTYLNAHMPVKFMFGRTKEHGLTLITCAGVFHRDGTGYDHKLVVYTRLILPSGKLG